MLPGNADAERIADARPSAGDSGNQPTPDAAGLGDTGPESAPGDAGDAEVGDDGGGPRPCDLFEAAGTSCVAAHSTTRALYVGYSGKLYQVQRASDGTTLDIGTLTTGGYADASAQDAFCSGTTCTIPTIYDQSPKGNDLTVSPAGSAGAADVPANASALQAIAGGHRVYGVYIKPGMGYRNLQAVGTAKNGQPESAYMVTSGRHVNAGCCFDYGNTEQPHAAGAGDGTMDAVYFGFRCEHPPCTGSGPWIAADLEDGLYQGNGSNVSNLPVTFPLVTAMLKNDGQAMFALKTGDAQSGGLTTQYAGTLPTKGNYIPMHQQGGIVLGAGGDNSNGSAGDFYEGVMTAGYPSDAAQDSVGYGAADSTAVVPTSEDVLVDWKYTTNSPPSSWNTATFDDSSWGAGAGPFGSNGTAGQTVGTAWTTPDIWIRQTFDASALSAAEINKLVLRIIHDESAEVYVNGVLAASFTGYITAYELDSMSPASQMAIKSNSANVIAAHCHNTTGGQIIDVGLYK